MTKRLATVAVEVLVAPGCAHGRKTVGLVRDVLRALGHEDVAVVTVAVADDAGAEQLRFPGSPTVRVNGDDIDPDAPTRIGVG